VVGRVQEECFEENRRLLCGSSTVNVERGGKGRWKKL
jgi:hypothetical protein